MSQSKTMKVPRGTMRRLRRSNMDQFNRDRRALGAKETGLVFIRAPSLNLQGYVRNGRLPRSDG